MQRVAQVTNDALADVGHEEARTVGADALEEVREENLCADDPGRAARDVGAHGRGLPVLHREESVDDFLDHPGEVRRPEGVEQHRAERDHEAGTVRGGVAKQTKEVVHSGPVWLLACRLA